MKPMNLFRLCASSSSLSCDTGSDSIETRPASGQIEQTKNVEQRAFAAAGRTDNGVDASGLDLQRHAAQARARVLPLRPGSVRSLRS